LGFDCPFANRTMTLYSSLEPPRYEAEAEAAHRAAAADPAQVTWEYGTATEWKTLGAQDEGAFAERGLVRFVGPREVTSRPEFGVDTAYWLRARWVSGVFAQPPQLRRILTNTMWASQTATLQDENLGSSNGEPNQVFQTVRTPVLLDPKIEVRESELPPAMERERILQEEGDDAVRTVEDASGRPREIWVRWHQMADFYGSGPRDRHYVLDHLTGQIYFGDGQHGLIPPQGRNNVRAALYRTGGGTRGNRAAQTITQLKSAVPYIDGVTNHEAAGGGAEAESLQSVKERGPKALRHRNRAVTVQDFEDLAYAASPNVARARALAANDTTNAGQIGIILVPRSAEAQPIPSLELINRVEDYIVARAAPTLDLWLAGPDWISVTVTAEIVPVSFEAVDALQRDVLTALQRFLHPLTGGAEGSGWDFGRRPHRSDLFALLESIGGVDHVRRLDVDPEALPATVQSDRLLVFSGDHKITVVSPVQEPTSR
jgi:predicted phage baseplate assembly protein